MAVDVSEAEGIFADFARGKDRVQIAPDKFVDVRAIGLGCRLGLGEVSKEGIDSQFAWLVANGCPAFKGLEPDDIESRLDPVVLSKLAARIMELSGLGKDAEAQAEKNSESDPG
ncbi:MAG: hypothetical protein AB9Q22_10220 [Candidatus Reddybacter sp.]